jgi:hypothetical protein
MAQTRFTYSYIPPSLATIQLFFLRSLIRVWLRRTTCCQRRPPSVVHWLRSMEKKR